MKSPLIVSTLVLASCILIAPPTLVTVLPIKLPLIVPIVDLSLKAIPPPVFARLPMKSALIVSIDASFDIWIPPLHPFV